MIQRCALKQINININATLGVNMIDANCTALRCDGCTKYNHNNKSFTDNCATTNDNFYQPTGLFADESTATALRNRLFDNPKQNRDRKDHMKNDNSNNSDNFNDNVESNNSAVKPRVHLDDIDNEGKSSCDDINADEKSNSQNPPPVNVCTKR